LLGVIIALKPLFVTNLKIFLLSVATKINFLFIAFEQASSTQRINSLLSIFIRGFPGSLDYLNLAGIIKTIFKFLA
jgi:hypothetical protein